MKQGRILHPRRTRDQRQPASRLTFVLALTCAPAAILAQSPGAPYPTSARPAGVHQKTLAKLSESPPRGLPDAPEPQAPSVPKAPAPQQGHSSISGTVMDANGSVVEEASVVLQRINTAEKVTLVSDSTGFFNFEGLQPGTFEITITAKGFSAWTETALPLLAGEDYDMPPIRLRVASERTDVAVVFTQHDLAEEQMQAQEKQRVLGFYPNFYTSYQWNAAPLSASQKFRLAWHSSIDPFSFISAGVAAGIQQSQNAFSGYGSGGEGFAKRFGAAYADDTIGTFLGGAILPAVLHQDPRYYYRGTGSLVSRALYAISTTVICKSDRGKWQPNYSNVIASFASGGISNLYYPASDRDGAGVTMENALIGIGSGAASALIQEFLLHHITPKAAGNGKP